MPTVASKISEIQAALDTLARQHKVPGASLGVVSGDELVEFSTGVANVNTGVPVTPSTLFQIGSNTKVYTATLVMQLVDEGKVELDAPVRTYLPDLKLGDAKAVPKITVRMLLTHTSGIHGDYFDDYGRGDDGIERFVASLDKIGQIYTPGEMWSYCNTGWTILGRLVEKLRGEPFHKVLKEKIVEPLGLKVTSILMEDMLAHSCAVGHVIPPDGTEPIVPPTVMMSPSHAPAGSMTVSTPSEVLKFLRMHFDSGRAASGEHVLSAASAKAMQQPQVKMPSIGLGVAMGLGWMLDEWDGERVIGHGGNTIGQASFLKALPDRRFGVTLLTNSGGGARLWRDLARYVFDELAGVHVPDMPKVPNAPPKIDLRPYAGLYRRLGIDLDVKVRNGHLVAEMTPTGSMAELAPPQTAAIRPVDAETFIANLAGAEAVVKFIDFDRQGRPTYLHLGARVSRRVAGGSTKRKAAGKARPKAKPAKRRSR